MNNNAKQELRRDIEMGVKELKKQFEQVEKMYTYETGQDMSDLSRDEMISVVREAFSSVGEEEEIYLDIISNIDSYIEFLLDVAYDDSAIDTIMDNITSEEIKKYVDSNFEEMMMALISIYDRRREEERKEDKMGEDKIKERFKKTCDDIYSTLYSYISIRKETNICEKDMKIETSYYKELLKKYNTHSDEIKTFVDSQIESFNPNGLMKFIEKIVDSIMYGNKNDVYEEEIIQDKKEDEIIKEDDKKTEKIIEVEEVIEVDKDEVKKDTPKQEVEVNYSQTPITEMEQDNETKNQNELIERCLFEASNKLFNLEYLEGEKVKTILDDMQSKLIDLKITSDRLKFSMEQLDAYSQFIQSNMTLDNYKNFNNIASQLSDLPSSMSYQDLNKILGFNEYVMSMGQYGLPASEIRYIAILSIGLALTRFKSENENTDVYMDLIKFNEFCKAGTFTNKDKQVFLGTTLPNYLLDTNRYGKLEYVDLDENNILKIKNNTFITTIENKTVSNISKIEEVIPTKKKTNRSTKKPASKKPQKNTTKSDKAE